MNYSIVLKFILLKNVVLLCFHEYMYMYIYMYGYRHVHVYLHVHVYTSFYLLCTINHISLMANNDVQYHIYFIIL